MDLELPDKFNGTVSIAVIGGTGLSYLPGFIPIASLNITTPWGPTSSPILILETGDAEQPVAFIARHGIHHSFSPSEVPVRANIAALRSIGVRTIVSFSAVGSLREEIKPRDFVIPNQVIDRTKGIRPSTYFEGGVVGHVGFADPFDEALAKLVKKCEGALEGDVTVHTDKTLICMEGPQFSTRAESKMYRSWGGDVINMSCLPEAKLAREAEMVYTMICMATDYDCFRDSAEPVNVPEVMANMEANSLNAKNLASALLVHLVKQEHKDLVNALKLKEGTKWGIMTKPEGRNPETVKKLSFLFPDYF